MDTFHELRLELSVTPANQAHLALFVTDRDGQWFLLEDWTAEPTCRNVVVDEASSMVSDWLAFGGQLLPA